MNNTETEFMSELEAAARLKPHGTSGVLLIAVSALIIFFLIWASFSEIEEMTNPFDFKSSGRLILIILVPI